MTFGMKFGSWAWALKRAQTRMEDARKVAATGAISGAVGTYSSIDPFVEQYVCERLGLVPDPLSTQVLARDRHAQVMAGPVSYTHLDVYKRQGNGRRRPAGRPSCRAC